MKFVIFTSALLILNINVYCQDSKSNLVNNYNKRLLFYLSPDTTDYKREVMFISIPAFLPEFSIGLETKAATSMLQFRTFKSNYWGEMFIQTIRNKAKVVDSEIESSQITVSKRFANNLKLLFQKVTSDSLSLLSPGYTGVDEPNYYLFCHNRRKHFGFNDVLNNDSYRQLISLCSDMANELKNKTFKEKKYLNIIEGLLRTEKNTSL